MNLDSEFQSHFGLILTVEYCMEKLEKELFQSHFGLILTEDDLRELAAKKNFNPILVWF